MALYQKLLSLQKAVVGLTKDKAGNSYQYVSGDKILSIVRPTMDNLGLLLVSEVLDYSFTRQDYNLYDKQGNPKPKTEIFCALRMRFTWVDAESGETLQCLWASSGQNLFDKSFGSAVTYGERYFLLKFFHIATDKDDVDAPKTPEEEVSVQTAIAYIKGAKDVASLQQLYAYYQQFPKIANDKEFLKEFNLLMKGFNNGTNTK